MYEPYPVPEQVREQKLSRYSSLWTFAKQDLRLLLFFLIIAGLVGLGIGYFWSCIFIAFVVFFTLQLRSLYLVNDWIANNPYDVPPNLNGIWGYLTFTVPSAKNVLFKEMVGLIDRAQSSLVALAEAVVLIDDQHQIEWWNPAAERLLGISPLDRGRNLLTILRQPTFIEYFNNIDQAPDGIKLHSNLDDDRYVQVKLHTWWGKPLTCGIRCNSYA